MKEVLKYFIAVFTKFGKEKQFVYNSMIYDGTEDDTSINDTNVIEYEFINLGSTVVVINNIPLYPVVSGKNWHHWKPIIGFNEMDVTIYKFKFTGPPDFWITNLVLNPTVSTPGKITPYDGPPIDRVRSYDSYLYNRLLVISKVKAYKRNSKPS